MSSSARSVPNARGWVRWWGRGQGSVTRVKYGPGAQVPEGLYVNVSFPTRFAKAQQPVRELVSFRLDEDKTWRLAGYSLRTAVK